MDRNGDKCDSELQTLYALACVTCVDNRYVVMSIVIFQCQEHLIRRQKLIAQDYKVSKGLARMCREDIKASHCRRSVSEDKEIRLAQILLCLEGVIRNGRLLIYI